jgi:serine/threonine-protein kinase
MAEEPLLIGRYALFDVIASGGMATVHVGRLLGPVGFARTVAIKRLHQEYARDPEFVSMFLDEARLAARIRHPNVVQTIDVVATKGELFLVMDFVQGESLARLCRIMSARGERIPVRVAVAILSGALQGLHAAHDAKDERGADLGIVHRDVSPQNILVGSDGLARVLDFGVAKAAGRMQTTKDGQVKGKLAYMAPEQVQALTITRTADVYSASVVAWETLVGERLFKGDSEASVLAKVLAGNVDPPSARCPELPRELDEVVMKGLARDPADRWASAREMALALEKRVTPASLPEVAEWFEPIVGPSLAERASLVARIETDSGVSSVDALAKRMKDELESDRAPGDQPFTHTFVGVGAAAPGEPPDARPVRKTAPLADAARLAMAIVAESERKAPTTARTDPHPMAPLPLPISPALARDSGLTPNPLVARPQETKSTGFVLLGALAAAALVVIAGGIAFVARTKYVATSAKPSADPVSIASISPPSSSSMSVSSSSPGSTPVEEAPSIAAPSASALPSSSTVAASSASAAPSSAPRAQPAGRGGRSGAASTARPHPSTWDMGGRF